MHVSCIFLLNLFWNKLHCKENFNFVIIFKTKESDSYRYYFSLNSKYDIKYNNLYFIWLLRLILWRRYIFNRSRGNGTIFIVDGLFIKKIIEFKRKLPKKSLLIRISLQAYDISNLLFDRSATKKIITWMLNDENIWKLRQKIRLVKFVCRSVYLALWTERVEYCKLL